MVKISPFTHTDIHLTFELIIFFTYLTKSDLHRISNINILPITLSDHSPLELLWDLGQQSTAKQWRLNVSLLNDTEFVNYIKDELKMYLELNVNPEVSPLILWDCAKAYLRGRIISFASAKKKKNQAKRLELENRITNLEQQHKHNSSPSVMKTLREARKELDRLMTGKIEGQLRFAKQKYYEQGSRASRLLAIQLRKQQTRNTVHKLKSKNPHSFLTKPSDISESFAHFYKNVYKNTGTYIDDEELKSYLQGIQLTEISNTMSEKLDSPIEIREIEEVISTLKNNKSPGPDGFCN